MVFDSNIENIFYMQTPPICIGGVRESYGTFIEQFIFECLIIVGVSG